MIYSLLTTEDYEKMNEVCSSVLSNTCTIAEWLTKHADLYKSCVIQPAGLPAIPMCYHNGEYYEKIAEFTSLYESRANPERSSLDLD